MLRKAHGMAIILLIGFGVAASGCTASADCAGQQAYEGQDGVCNEENSFAYGSQVGSKSDTETHTWTNTEGQAEVNWGGQGQGSLSVTIEDANGERVFSSTFSGGQSGGSQTTAAGEPGDWTIRLDFDNFSGQIGLSVQAR